MMAAHCDRAPVRVWLLLMAAFFLLAGCANPVTRGVSSIFGGGDEEKEEDAEEDDDRISILALEEELVADPRFVGVSIELPPSYLNASWAQPGGEADHTLHHLNATLELERVWSVDIGAASPSRARLTSPPIVVSDRVFVLDAEAKVSAYNVDDGDLIWRTKLTPDISERFRIREIFRGPKPSHIGFGGGVAFDQGRIFATSGFGFVAGLDAVTGKELWRTQTEAPVRTPPTAYRGLVFLTTITNEFIALNQETGERMDLQLL